MSATVSLFTVMFYSHRMQSSKFVVKCGQFAVLVDLHSLPGGGQESSGGFSQEHKEEVTGLIKDAVEQRVKEFLDRRHGQSKQKKDASAENPIFLKGRSLRLAAYFMKRHVNLRCVVKHRHTGLRVFPERFVVCAHLTENASTPAGEADPETAPGTQSRSGYFSSPRPSRDSTDGSAATTKEAALRKIARQVDGRPLAGQQPKTQLREQMGQEASTSEVAEAGLKEEVGFSSGQKALETNAPALPGTSGAEEKREGPARDLETSGRRRRRSPRSPDSGDEDGQRAKRACRQNGASADSPPPLPPPRPPSPSAAAAASQLAPALESELLTHGKQASNLPRSQSTANETNPSPSRPAASLRSRSVKAVSSGSSISSRSTTKQEKEKEESARAPGISRLRRLKKSQEGRRLEQDP